MGSFRVIVLTDSESRRIRGASLEVTTMATWKLFLLSIVLALVAGALARYFLGDLWGWIVGGLSLLVPSAIALIAIGGNVLLSQYDHPFRSH